jgi:hypothetical protein
MQETKNLYRVYFVNLKDKDHLTDPQVNGGMILKWMLTKKDGDVDRIHIAQGGNTSKFL